MLSDPGGRVTEGRAAAEAGFDPARLERLDRHFAGYVDDGRLAGWELALTRHDGVVHTSSYGWRDREAEVPVDGKTVWRIASMTKPITAVAAMSLWEEGAFELTDPISRWLPEFAQPQVYVKGNHLNPFTAPSQEPIRVWHLLSHASGLSAGFMYTHVVDHLYRAAGYEWGAPPGSTLADCVRDWAALPLRFEPGTAWGYGVSTDVLGRLLEVVTGKTLDEVFTERVLRPLGMDDTGFFAEGPRADRLPAVYQRDPATGGALRNDAMSQSGRVMPTVLSGGGGLVSTLDDYTRFTRMLALEGELDGVRLLTPATVRLMRQNHLPGDLGQVSTGGFAETTFDGVGFGLGFATVLDPVKLRSPSSPGEFYWGGAYSTAFWVDPVTGITCTFMAQLFPSSTYPIRAQLRQLVYSAFTG
jgi:CubicO group peptidase (beta-lactamase class C family)